MSRRRRRENPTVFGGRRWSKSLGLWVPTMETLIRELNERWGAPAMSDRCFTCRDTRPVNGRIRACHRRPVVRVPSFILGHVILDSLCRVHAAGLAKDAVFLRTGMTSSNAEAWRFAPPSSVVPASYIAEIGWLQGAAEGLTEAVRRIVEIAKNDRSVDALVLADELLQAAEMIHREAVEMRRGLP